MNEGQPLLRVEGVRKHFAFTKGILFAKTLGHVKAVDDVSFDIRAGETLGLVGESGCGKTTTSRMILNLEEPTEGRILLDGEPIHALKGEALRAYRAKVQAVFQDPWSSLNPRMKVGRTIAESLIVNASRNRRRGDQARIDARVRELLLQVGLRPEQAQQYPHEFSGGQRQRVALAAALASQPKLIVLDEPVSALDVSIQAQIVNLMEQLQQDFELTYLFIAHDLAVVRHISDRVGVMYAGRIVEIHRALDGGRTEVQRADVVALGDVHVRQRVLAVAHAAAERVLRFTRHGCLPSGCRPWVANREC